VSAPLPQVAGRVVYNRTPLRAGAVLPPPGPGDVPRATFKHASLERVRAETTDWVRAVLDAVPLRGAHRWVVVDVKVTDLVPGRLPCVPGWHVDAVLDPFHATRPEVHHLLVTGTGCLTEFVAAPVELDVRPATCPKAFLADVNRQLALLDPPVRAVPSNTLVEYGRLDLHRGARAVARETRVLVRVTETDLIAPTCTARRRLTVGS
jgi:hypothetical protein